MRNDEECVETSTNRRGFVRRCLGTGVILAAPSTCHAQISGTEIARRPLGTASPILAEYERILSQTDRMDVLGRPRTWLVVERGFHPFSPERIVVMPAGSDHFGFGGRYGDRCERALRRRIDERIGELIKDTKRRNPGYDPVDGWFPDSKRESSFWMMDAMTDHYEVRSQFEAWVVGLVGRELLGSTAWCGCGMAHQFQHGSRHHQRATCPDPLGHTAGCDPPVPDPSRIS